MKSTGIVFSGPMVRALLDGRKTQTRRLLKPQPIYPPFKSQVEGRGWFSITSRDGILDQWKCPYGQPGDELWVRETWATCRDECFTRLVYRATDPDWEGPWKSPRFMPRWASRITLQLTAVRVERLRDITEADAKEEGVERVIPHYVECYKDYSNPTDWASQGTGFYSPIQSYRSLWDSINSKKAPWASNPFVWVLEFKRKDK